MSMIVARMEKMKSENLIGIGNHNQRKTQNHSNKDIDITKSDLNYDLVNRTENYKTDIENFINENKSSTRANRKDAVLINEWIITSDKKFFENLSDEETKDFFISAKEYFGKEFGEENIRYATIHLDESTPHMHMGIIPFDDEKKLSAKRIFNREALRNIQENLPKYLQEKGFGIERGLEGSDRKNLTVKEFKELKEEEKEIDRLIETKKKELIIYTKENKIDELDIVARKEMKEVEVKTDEKNLFGKNKTETVKKWTGNIILTEDDYIKMTRNINKGLKAKKKLIDVLNTDTYKEIGDLKKELKKEKDHKEEIIKNMYSMSYDYEDKLKDLKEENTNLKATVRDLREEIILIYNSTKDFIKEHTEDLNSFKDRLKGIADDLSNKMNGKSYFKKEFDTEFTKKPKISLEDLKQISKNQKENEVTSVKKNRDRSR